MSVWNTYETRSSIRGNTKRETVFNRETRTILNKAPDNLSFHSVIIYDAEHGYNIDDTVGADGDGIVDRNVTILNSDNLNEKTIIALPGEDLFEGQLVRWATNYWLITERDANSELYTKAKMLQCNHLLKWINKDGILIKQWSIVEDGTKYLTGEFEDRNFVVTRGDSRISVQVAKNKETVALDRTNRFLIDDDDSPHKLAYLLTKPLKKGLTYNGIGTFKFVMQEVTATEYDNHELGIADYNKLAEVIEQQDEQPESHEELIERGVWL